MKQYAHICNKRKTLFPECYNKHKLTYGQGQNYKKIKTRQHLYCKLYSSALRSRLSSESELWLLVIK